MNEFEKIKIVRKPKSLRNYKKSLEYYANENNMEYLLIEFSEKNKKNPSEISYGTNDHKYWWKCLKCNSEYDMTPNSRTSVGNNCPYCRGKRVNHTNCLWTTRPDVAKLLKNPQRGYELTAGSNKKEEFVCNECGNSQYKLVFNVVRQGFYCSKCSDGLKYPEKFMISFLNQLNINYETQKLFNWAKKVDNDNSKLSGNKKYDFYLPSFNLIIETHGLQHYDGGFKSFGGRNLEEEQENDRIKEQLAKENGIENYIVIDCKISDLEFIKERILSSELAVMFNLNLLDWFECHEHTFTNLVRTVCALWKDGVKNTAAISKIVKLERSAIINYLKKGTKVGWIDYDPKIEMKINGALNGKKGALKIVQLSLDGQYIETWNGASDVKRELGISQGNISSVCRGERKSASGFKWMLESDYEKLNEN